MPVLTLAELVVDQAIGIAIGVAAIVAAPKAGPKLASLSDNLLDSVKSAAIPAASAAGRVIVGKATGGVRWYGQEWASLIEESTPQPAIAAGDVSSVAGLLAGLATAEVVSQAPGRVRLRLHQLQGHPQLVEPLAEALVRVDGIGRVQVNPTTGSVLVLYDTGRYASLDTLLAAVVRSEGPVKE